MNFKDLTKLEQQEITEVLEQFGLNEKDREIYFVLLNLGQATITPLARAVKYPITTVQSIVKKLDSKGLLKVSARKSRHVYGAEDPSVLKKILEQRVQELTNVIPLLKKMEPEEISNVKIRVYYRERMADIFHEALKSKEGLVYEIVSASDLQHILGEKFHFTRRRVKAGVQLKSLRVETHEIKKYNEKIHERELREAKFLPRELTFRSSIIFWDNTAAFFTTKNEGLAWTVESAIISEMMKQLFELLWSVSRKMETLEN